MPLFGLAAVSRHTYTPSLYAACSIHMADGSYREECVYIIGNAVGLPSQCGDVVLEVLIILCI